MSCCASGRPVASWTRRARDVVVAPGMSSTRRRARATRRPANAHETVVSAVASGEEGAAGHPPGRLETHLT